MKKETQTIEYKQSWHDEYLKWIFGFANAQGGKLFSFLSRANAHAQSWTKH